MKKDQQHIDERWLILHLLDEIPDAGRAEVEQWISASEANREVYDRLRKTWEETGRLGVKGPVWDVDQAWKRLSDRMTADDERPIQKALSKKNNRIRVLRFTATAAAIMLILMATWLLLIRQKAGPPALGILLTSSESATLSDTLADGSSVLLNLSSSLSAPAGFGVDKRQLSLEGEAFFEVKHRDSQPFTIGTALGNIRVLGTSFQVKAYPSSDLEVFVEKGRVELSSVDAGGLTLESVILSAGERGIIRYPGRELIAGGRLQPDDLFWVNRKLIFEETSLDLVFDLLERHYETDIRVENDSLLLCRLTATFNDEAIEQILTVIAASFDLMIEQDGQGFLITGKGCSND